jgi:hypothetical protein
MQSSISIKPFRLFILLFISCCFGIISYGQQKTLKDISNEILLNAFVYGKTDTDLFNFLKAYIPYLTKEPPKGQIINPPRIEGEENFIMQSYFFKKHPLFNFKMSTARLDFLLVQYTVPGYKVDDKNLWFMFDKKEDADSAFNAIANLLGEYAEQKDIKEANGSKTAKFLEKTSDKWSRKALLVLTKDEVFDNKYKILFKNWYPF